MNLMDTELSYNTENWLEVDNIDFDIFIKSEWEPIKSTEEIVEDKFMNQKIEEPDLPIFILIDENRKLLPENPIKVHIYRDGEYYIAENEKLNISAIGTSYKEAIENFEDLVIYFWKHYKEISQNDINGYAIELKEIYVNLFKIL